MHQNLQINFFLRMFNLTSLFLGYLFRHLLYQSTTMSFVNPNLPLLCKHINILGKYSFVLPESVRDGKLRELDNENFP